MAADPATEMLCSGFEYWMMDKSRKITILSFNLLMITHTFKLNVNTEVHVGISHEAVLLQETAKPALFRATTNILSSDQ
jgi:hypothetical protein